MLPYGHVLPHSRTVRLLQKSITPYKINSRRDVLDKYFSA